MQRARAIRRAYVTPRWDGDSSPAFRLWAQKWVSQNQWRVSHILGDHEDCVQHCALLFTEVSERYSSVVDNPKWLMALYKRTVVNSWNLLSKRDCNQRGIPAQYAERGYVDVQIPGFPLLLTFSAEALDVLMVMANAPAHLLKDFWYGVRSEVAAEIESEIPVSKILQEPQR